MMEEKFNNVQEYHGIRAGYERDLNHAWLLLEIEEVYKEDYQMKMLGCNDVRRLLTVQGQGRDEKSIYRYDISGKTSMKACYENTVASCRDMEEFMKQFIEALKEVQNLLLNPDGLVLSPDFVYREGGQFYFCFCPGKRGAVREEFHQLTEYFVKKADYEEKEAIYLAYELHKASMEENYNIEKVLEDILDKKDAEVQKMAVDKEDTYVLEEDLWLGDWESEQELAGNRIKERSGVWGLVNEKLRKRKKKAWGEWEGIE